MNNQEVSAPKIKRESKNRIRVDFERTSFWKRMRLKFFSMHFLGTALWKIVRFLLLLGISYVILMPFFTKISSSFMSGDDFVDATVKLIPKYPTIATYKAIIRSNGYWTALMNTALLSLAAALYQTFVCSMIGYGFAKFKFRGNKILFLLVILTMIVPPRTIQFSMFMNFRYFDFGYLLKKFAGHGLIEMITGSSINFTNTYWPIMFLSFTGLGFKNGLYIFMMRQYFRGVPDELEESAYLDGYGTFRTFLKIIIPLSVPMMITVFLFAFSWQWTDNFYTNLFFTTLGPKLLPSIISVPKSLDTSMAPTMFSSAVSNACAMLIITPLIVIYLFCQRYLIQGIERSGIVG